MVDVEKHALDYLNEIGAQNHSFVVFGKGPSFRVDVLKTAPQSKIVAINNSINALPKADICILNDYGVIASFSDAAIKNTKMFMAPSYPHHHEISKGKHNLSFYKKLSKNLDKMSQKLCLFDLNTNYQKLFPDKPTVCSYNSTFESIVWLLAWSGVKKIYTSGIDYSSEYNPLFGKRDPAVPFSAMKYYVQVAIDAYKLEVTPL